MLARARSLVVAMTAFAVTALSVCGIAHAQGEPPDEVPAPAPASPPAPVVPPPPVRPAPAPYPAYRVVPPPEMPRLTLFPMAGVQVGGRIDTNLGTLDIDLGGTYGLAVDVRIFRSSGIELSYTYQATSLTLEQRYASALTLFDLGVHHAQVAYVQELFLGRVRPFLGIGAGAAVFVPHIATLPTELQFAFHAQVGMNVYVTEAIGVRVLGRLMSTFFQSDSGLFCSVGTGGGGCSLGLLGDVAQFALLAGPTLAF